MPRRLGQHFLRPDWVERLLEAISPATHETFLEIGAGKGALTLPLAARAGRVVAVELDSSLARGLEDRAPANVTIVHGDALMLDLAALVPRGSRLAGNLPYYISSPLLRRFLSLRSQLADVHVLLQEEVARRVVAPPGGKEYGILSVLYALWCDSECVLALPPSAFAPPPKVRSALLRARFLPEPRAEADAGRMEELLKAAFARRRRTLENNLRDRYANLKENLRFLNIEGSRRPETLSVGEFALLARVLVPR